MPVVRVFSAAVSERPTLATSGQGTSSRSLLGRRWLLTSLSLCRRLRLSGSFLVVRFTARAAPSALSNALITSSASVVGVSFGEVVRCLCEGRGRGPHLPTGIGNDKSPQGPFFSR
ncbi:hypothetical protein MRX96_038142 [Rhipicephalus microplus]